MSEPAQQESPKRLEIRKYPNRRYYDSTRSRHVTLEDIYGLIRDGYDVQIIDSKSGDDITAKVLAQIIIELDPPKLGVFPVPLLHRLLRSNEQLVNDFVSKYFSQAFTAFLDSQRNMEQYLRQAMGMQTSVPTMSDWTKMMWGSLNPALWPQRPAGAAEAGPGSASSATPPPAAPSPAPPPSAADQSDLREVIADLRRELSELQSQIRTDRGNGKKSGRRAD